MFTLSLEVGKTALEGFFPKYPGIFSKIPRNPHLTLLLLPPLKKTLFANDHRRKKNMHILRCRKIQYAIEKVAVYCHIYFAMQKEEYAIEKVAVYCHIYFAMQKEEYAIEKVKKDIFIASNLPYRLNLRRVKVTKFSSTKFITTYFFIKQEGEKVKGT